MPHIGGSPARSMDFCCLSFQPRWLKGYFKVKLFEKSGKAVVKAAGHVGDVWFEGWNSTASLALSPNTRASSHMPLTSFTGEVCESSQV